MADSRVSSLVDISTDLLEAFQDSAKEGSIAVVFVDEYNDAHSIKSVEYSDKYKCIVVKLGVADVDLNNCEKEIERINNGQ